MFGQRRWFAWLKCLQPCPVPSERVTQPLGGQAALSLCCLWMMGCLNTRVAEATSAMASPQEQQCVSWVTFDPELKSVLGWTRILLRNCAESLLPGISQCDSQLCSLAVCTRGSMIWVTATLCHYALESWTNRPCVNVKKKRALGWEWGPSVKKPTTDEVLPKPLGHRRLLPQSPWTKASLEQRLPGVAVGGVSHALNAFLKQRVLLRARLYSKPGCRLIWPSFVACREDPLLIVTLLYLGH